MRSKISDMMKRLGSAEPMTDEEQGDLLAEMRDLLLSAPEKASEATKGTLPDDPVEEALDQAAVLSAFYLEDLVPEYEASVEVRSALLRATRAFTYDGQTLRYLSAAHRPDRLLNLAERDSLAALFEASRHLDRGPFAETFQLFLNVYGRDGLPGLLAELNPAPSRSVEYLREEARILNWIAPAQTRQPKGGSADVGLAEMRVAYQQAITVAETEAQLAQEVERFVGREDLLNWLEAELFGTEETYGVPPIVALHGIGGIGKSAILAALVVQLRATRPDLLLARIDFDRPGLSEADPSFLGDVVVRQIAAQAQLTDGEFLATAASSQSTQANLKVESALSFQGYSQDALFQVRYQAGIDRPLLLILDTLEERQRQGREAMTRLYDWLRNFGEGFGSGKVAILVAGRAQPTVNGFEFPDHVLRQVDELNQNEQLELLLSLGHSSPQAERLTGLSGNPLLLHLLSRLVKQKGGPTVEELTGDKVEEASAEALQGVIYDRILLHVTDKEARKLAYPGLVLRHVTPDLVARVIAPTILGKEVGEDRALALFEALRQEVWLVEDAGDDRVRHRADVRRVMMSYLSKDEEMAPQAEAIHEAAAAYFKENGQEAEQVYHTAMVVPAEELTGLTAQAATRWLEQIGGDQDFLPQSTLAVLRARAGLTLSDAEIIALPDDLAEDYIGELGPDLVEREHLRRAVALGNRSSRWTQSDWLRQARDGLGEWQLFSKDEGEADVAPSRVSNFWIDGLANLRQGAWDAVLNAASRAAAASTRFSSARTKGLGSQREPLALSKVLRQATYAAIAREQGDTDSAGLDDPGFGAIVAVLDFARDGLRARNQSEFNRIEPDWLTVMEDHHRLWHLMSRTGDLKRLHPDLARIYTRSRYLFVPSLDWIDRAHWAAREARENLASWGGTQKRLKEFADGAPFYVQDMTDDMASDMVYMVAKLPVAYRRMPVFQGTGFPEHRLPLRFALSEALALREETYLEVLTLFSDLCARTGRLVPEDLKPVPQPSFPTTIEGTDAFVVPLLLYADQCALLPEFAQVLVDKFPEAEKLARVEADLSRWAKVILPPDLRAEANAPLVL